MIEPAPAVPPEEDEDKVIVLCLDIARNPIPAAEGTIGRTCGACGTGVWLSPATAAALAGRKFELRCPDCLPPREDDDEVMAPTPGQLAEILRALGPEGAEAARRLTESPAKRARALEDILRKARRDRGRRDP